MNIKNIMCPVDFSEHSELALNYARFIAEATGATIHLVHATIPPVEYIQGYLEVKKEIEEQRNHALQELNSIDIPGVPVERHLLGGVPMDEVVKYADSNNIDLIVIPTHGRSGVMRLLMGSVAEEIVRKAPCPVMAVKPRVAETDKKTVKQTKVEH